MEQSTISNQAVTLFEKSKLFIKAVILFVMAFILWIPTHLVMDLIKERKERQHEAVADISNKWAGKQTITGPVLMIPYTSSAAQKKYAWFLADQLDIRSLLSPQIRHRGIYNVVVYESAVFIKATYNDINWQVLGVSADQILWNEAKLLIRVSDIPHGINDELYINWANSRILCQPWDDQTVSMNDALYAAVPLQPGDSSKSQVFTFNFSLHGSQQLMFTPAARETKIRMEGNWPDPSFTGVKIPDTLLQSDRGFDVNWKYLNRTTPLVWKDEFVSMQSLAMGANLLIPVDNYNKTERSVKYALLCIILTFAAFFLIETIHKKNLHLIQYGLTGCALVLFYTLLLSISEYTGFNPAYLIASLATIGLITWFVGSIMKSSRLAAFISFVLAIVYGYIFIIIQLQDYALLMGSIGLFVALGIIMYFSRRLQW